MPIDTVDVPVTSVHGTSTKRNPSSELGKDDFLLLLTEQLKNQDPMNPMEDMEFISQMSSFSSLEQMLNMNENIEGFVQEFKSNQKSDAMRFLGTTVTATKQSLEEPVTGVVEMIGFESGTPYLKVGEHSFTIDEVQIVSPTMYPSESGDSADESA
ncbi:MAG: flagellar hook capping FlgD N-terminal domain-containing protein [Candidatus Rifleibacteriota bacterium]